MLYIHVNTLYTFYIYILYYYFFSDVCMCVVPDCLTRFSPFSRSSSPLVLLYMLF